MNLVQAIDVQCMDPGALRWRRRGRRIEPHRLPMTMIDPAREPGAAVLSWRWDVSTRGRSRNAQGAMAHAATCGLRWLFMDLVSIDQGLSGDAMLEAVAGFSALYRSLPVLVAYDMPGITPTAWTRSVRRPWILREIREFHANPNRITYVAHQKNQGANETIGFPHMVNRIWKSSFTHTILHMLCGQIEMYDIADLRFVLPAHAGVLDAARAQMGRNDFLLTAALLTQLPVADHRLNEELDLQALLFERYRLEPVPEGGTYDSNFAILLDGERVGTWLSHYNLYHGEHRRKLEVVPEVEQIVFRKLGLPDASWPAFAADAGRRRESLVLPAGDGKVAQRIDIVRVARRGA